MKKGVSIVILMLTFVPILACDLMCVVGYIGEKYRQKIIDLHNALIAWSFQPELNDDYN